MVDKKPRKHRGPRKARDSQSGKTQQYRELFYRVCRDGYWLLLQLVPPTEWDSPACHCRMTGCQYDNSRVLPGDFMLSLERSYNKESKLGRLAKLDSTEVKREPRGPTGRLGLGIAGQEYYCLDCIERAFYSHAESGGQRGQRIQPKGLRIVANRVLADERYCEDYPGSFTIGPAYKYALELWKTAGQQTESGPAHGSPEDVSVEGAFIDGARFESVVKAVHVGDRELSAVLAFMRTSIAEHSNGTIDVIKPRGESITRATVLGPIQWRYFTMLDISCSEWCSAWEAKESSTRTQRTRAVGSSTAAPPTPTSASTQAQTTTSSGTTPANNTLLASPTNPGAPISRNNTTATLERSATPPSSSARAPSSLPAVPAMNRTSPSRPSANETAAVAGTASAPILIPSSPSPPSSPTPTRAPRLEIEAREASPFVHAAREARRRAAERQQRAEQGEEEDAEMESRANEANGKRKRKEIEKEKGKGKEIEQQQQQEEDEQQEEEEEGETQEQPEERVEEPVGKKRRTGPFNDDTSSEDEEERTKAENALKFKNRYAWEDL